MVLSESELKIKNNILNNCYIPAGLDEVWANACDVIEKDILDLLWAKINFYELIVHHQ